MWQPGPSLAASVVDQAAAEYVGVMLATAARSVESGLTSASTWVSSHPLAVGAALLALVVVWRVFGRH